MQGNTFLTDAKKSTFKELSIVHKGNRNIIYIYVYSDGDMCIIL